MPLPTGGPWPPRDLEPIYFQIALWSAWYAGDPDELSLIYGGDTTARQFAGTGFAVGSSMQVGWFRRLRDQLQRWFWGTRTSDRQLRTKLHVPVAADIAAMSADLLFSEPPTLTIPEDAEGSTATQDRLNELADPRTQAGLLEAAELAAALGGVYLQVVWDREIAKRPWLAAVHADAAVPEWRWGRLWAVTLWRVVHEDGNTVWRHLERHEPGTIAHGLYKGSRMDLGRRVPLGEHPETAPLADGLDAEGTMSTGLADRLTVVYVPNMRPNRLWRNRPAAVHLGRADYAGVESLMDALDETYSSWMRDVRFGKGRIIVPDAYLTPQGPGQGATWEAEREIYAGLRMLPGPEDTPPITVAQFAIRVAEHRETAADLLAQILRAGGYAQQSFGEHADGQALTATEIRARERRTFVTRDRKITYWRPELAEIFETMLAIDARVFKTSGVSPVAPDIEFGDSVSEDLRTLAETVDLLNRANAASTDTLVRTVHPEWDDTRVDNEVKAIRAATDLDPDDLLRRAAGAGRLDNPDDDPDPGDEPPAP